MVQPRHNVSRPNDRLPLIVEVTGRIVVVDHFLSHHRVIMKYSLKWNHLGEDIDMISADFKIETDRLVLRPFVEEDCPAMLRIQSNPKMT